MALAGRYGNPIPPRFLAPIDGSKIPAQKAGENIYSIGKLYKYVQYSRSWPWIIKKEYMNSSSSGCFVEIAEARVVIHSRAPASLEQV